ncbi:LysR family transcriptional regulator [Reinekea thalattae]|uniref:LysR family transcriptional regulator n=1 Tax=Reinekea thalattae TaxID=2593301 RepID=A0A5C8Z7S2_9GAMM|nr:LysR family transcriptional regulator [Reinekea thalattae]TXR53369.1 LysR family transcriptional regulator [Reinekea thalattae]
MNEHTNLLSINWNDLKYFLALSRYGRLSLAASKLGCTHVTIANRIEQLEKAVGTRLFFQNSKGFHLTKAGEDLIPYAEECERTLRLANEKYRSTQQIRSTIRIGVTEGFSNYFLSSHLPVWIKHKNIDIELVSLAGITYITSGDVDISITIGPQKGENFIQRKLTDYTLGLFASHSYLEEHPKIKKRDDLEAHHFIGYIEDQLFTDLLKYQSEIYPALEFIYQSTTIHTQHKAVQSGLGIGILPHFVAYGDDGLSPVLPDILLHRELWISTSKDLHQFRDLKLTWEFILSQTQEQSFRFKPNAG